MIKQLVYKDANGTETKYHYATNNRGDVIALYNASGEKVVSYAYDAWGNVLSVTGTEANGIGQKNPIRYRGYYYDVETGWYYLSSRYYDPETLRYINSDLYLSTGDGFNG